MDHWENEKEVQQYLRIWPISHPNEPAYVHVSDGAMALRGTWAHPQLAAWAATCCNPIIGQAVCTLTDKYRKGQVTTSNSLAAASAMNHICKQQKSVYRD